MSRPRRQHLSEKAAGCGLLAALLLFGPLRAQGSPIAMTADQYRLYRRYVTALATPAMRRLPAAKRLRVMTRKLQVRRSVLRAAVAAGDTLGPTLAEAGKKEIRAELEDTPLKGRVVDVDIDASSAHVVTYVEWRNVEADKLDEEATTVAYVAARAAPITSTIALWARDQAGQKIFEAKIGGETASHFQEARIGMFAHTRYIHMFEDVRRGAEIKPESPRPGSPR